MAKLSLLTMGHGNVNVLRETLKSFAPYCDEVIYGELLLFSEDRDRLKIYESEFNLKPVRLPFNYIFHAGFANTLNFLAAHAKNDYVIYMNTSEIVEIDFGILDIINANQDCNAFYFTNKNEKHRWHRAYNRNEMQWQGAIHEEIYPIKGDIRPYHKPIFQMADLEKDMDDAFKAAVFNLVKQLVYFEQYRKIIDYPKLLQGTNEGWLKWAKEQTPSMQERLNEMGVFYESFKKGDFDMFIDAIYTDDYFKDIRLESSKLVNLQGMRRDVL